MRSARCIELTSKDVLLGVLPFFHSFGFTGTLWLPALSGFGVVYHPEPDGREDDRRAGRPLPRDDHHQHADVLLVVHPQVRAGAVQAPSLRDCRRRAAARADRGRVQGEVRRRPARRLRLHRDVAGRRGQRAGRRGRPRAPARHARRIGRPSAARRRGEDRRSGDGRRSAVRPGGPAAREGTEPHARLSRRAGARRPRCFATAGTSPATSRRSTRPVSCGSPIACRASARSPARWCRT